MSADQKPQNPTTLTEGPPQEMLVPRDWLAAVVRLLDVMAGEGVGMENCEDPADLVITLADHFGVGDFDDYLQAVLEKIANHGRSPDPQEHKGGSWVCQSCGWEGDPDVVGDKCPGCGREIEDSEP